jgi:hypothetical protein
MAWSNEPEAVAFDHQVVVHRQPLLWGSTHQNTRQLANALERKGFLRITADRRDARIRRLHTTRHSRAYWNRRAASDQQLVLDWFSSLTEHEAKTLFELLLRLQHGLNQHARTAQSPPAGTQPGGEPAVATTEPG